MACPRDVSWLLLVACFVRVSLTSDSVNDECYKVIYGTHDYIEYQVGDEKSNIILASPHGGFMKPNSIADRSTGCYMPKTKSCLYSHNPCESKSTATCKNAITRQDEFTRNLTLILADELKRLIGQRPHVILNNLHRSKLDANRPLDQASFWEYESVIAWHEFSSFVVEAKQKLKGPGVFFDIHRQRHSENWAELGYRITNRDLISGNYTADDSSIKSLAHANPQVKFEDYINGNISLGYYLQDEGYKTVPSPQHPRPPLNLGGYYRGGYNTWVYGSQILGNVDAIQIESPMVLMNAEKGPTYGRALARALHQFMKRHYKGTDAPRSALRMCDKVSNGGQFTQTRLSVIMSIAMLFSYIYAVAPLEL